MSEVLYEVGGLRREFGKEPQKVIALDGVDLTVSAGQRLGIVGESGSGKSTLIRLMAALDQPTAGTVTFRGERVSNRRERDLGFLRSAAQLVFQDPRSSLNPRMNVRDIITEPLRSRLLRRELGIDPQQRLGELLAAVDLDPDMADRFPHEFSGGQRQRIAIARALAPKPDVLIADEPVSALDVSVRAQVLNLLTDLVSSLGLTLIFVSHDLTVVRHLCDTVMVMRQGNVVESGPTESVFTDPQDEYTKTLLAAVPKIRTGRAPA